jgi:hypothetical protein
MVAAILCLLLLAGCAGGTQPAPVAAAAPAAASPPPAPPPTASRRGARAPVAHIEDPDAPTPTGDPVIQARADCWMAVEHRHELRGIDQRIAFVDKCVAGKVKE